MLKQISNPTPAVPAVFQFENHEVRTIEQDGDVWFVAKDITDILGYSKSDSALRSHCKAAKTCSFKMEDQVRVVTIIPERDMYRLVMKSTLPAAEEFEEFIVSEVLPSIRKHGHYMTSAQGMSSLPAIPKDPLELFLMTAEAIKQLSNRTIQIESQLTQMEDVALEAVAKSEQAVTTVDDFLATRPLTHTQCYEVRLAVEKKKQLLTDKYSIPSGGTVYAGLYSFLKHHFRVNTYTGIPSARYDEALMIINNITLDQLPENVRKAVPKAKAKKGGAK